MKIINLKNCKKIYSQKNDKIIAVNNVNIAFETGKFYAIMGKSGSGKSTLLQCMGLVDNFTEGIMYIDSKNVSQLSEKEKSKIRKNKIGFIFQSFYLNPIFNAKENVMLPLFLNKNMTNQEISIRAEKLLKLVGLECRKNHLPKELSGGEQQRIAIARALANNPDIILADEPTGNLDQTNEKNILFLLKKLSNSGKCVIVVSHNPNIRDYADCVIKMEEGKLVFNNE